MLIEVNRPKSKFSSWEEPPQEGEPFDYDAVPNKFYMDIESVGSMPPDEIMQQGIKYLQEKLATVIKTFRKDGDGADGGDGFDDSGVRSPGMDYGMGGLGGPGGGGYETPFAGSDGRTPYANYGGATPYGNTTPGYNANWS